MTPEEANRFAAEAAFDKLLRVMANFGWRRPECVQVIADAIGAQRKRDTKVAREFADVCSCAETIAKAIQKSGL